MSNPTDPPRPSDDEPVGAQPGADAPTEAYPAPDAPTQAYPGYAAPEAQPGAPAYSAADAQPTEVYPPAAGYAQPQAPAYGQPPQGQPPYGQPPYGQPVAPAPAPDTRPKGLAWAALGTAVAGLVLVLVAFIPILWVSFVLACVGGLLLLVGLVLGIVALVSKKQGGMGLGIGAIIVSVLGGVVWIIALTWSLLLIGLSAADSATPFDPSPPPAVTEPESPSTDGEGTTPDDEGDAGDVTATGDEAAYLAEVRPVVTEIMQEVEPGITQEMIDVAFSDEILVSLGETVLMGGDLARDAMITSFSGASGGMFSEEQATRLFDAVLAAADQHLAG